MKNRAYPGIWDAVVLMILVVLLLFSYSIAVSAAGGFVTLPPRSIMTATGNILAIGLVLMFGQKKTGSSFREVFPFRAADPLFIAAVIFTTTGFAIVLSEFDNLLRYFLPVPGYLAEVLAGFYEDGDIWGSLALLVIVAPLTEEFLFRGLVLHGFFRNYSPFKAIVISSLMFGLLHLNPWQFTSAFVLGLFLGWIFFVTRSLVPCIAVHAFFNGLPFLFAKVLDVEIEGLTTGLTGPHAFQPLWLDMIGLLVSITGLMLLYQISRTGRRFTH